MMLKNFWSLILTVIRILLFLLISIPYFFLIIVIPFVVRSERLSEIFCSYWFRTLFYIFGIRLYVKKISQIPDDKFIIFSNHLSFLDIPAVVLALWGKRIKFVAKEGVLKYPIIGWGLKIQNHIILKEGSEFSSVRKIVRTIEREDVDCICIFPEGTRGTSSEQVQPFKEGVSFIFDLIKKPLVPLAIIGTEKIYPVGAFVPKSGVIKVIIGNPITYQSFVFFESKSKVRRKVLSEKIHQELLELIKMNL